MDFLISREVLGDASLYAGNRDTVRNFVIFDKMRLLCST